MSQVSLARHIVDVGGGIRVVAFDSITHLEAFYRETPPSGGDVIVNGSYAGVFCAREVAKFRPHAAIGLDCGIGKDGAGIAGLWYYEALNIAAAAADVMSAGMGDGDDIYRNGRISRMNQFAEDAGVTVGMPVPEAAAIIGRAPKSPAVETIHTNRLVVKTDARGRMIVCSDGLAAAAGMDAARIVLCAGAHSGLSVVGYVKRLRPLGFLLSDGGMGKNRSGVAGLDPLDDAGIAGASVNALTARMGDGRSTYFDGVVSAVNARAAAKGVAIGQTAIEAADLLLDD